jgi:tRNA pseudouridine38-40 synthase
MPIRTLKLTLAYDGTNYVGWQRQVNGLSVQEVVESSFVPLMVTARERKNVAGDQAPAARRGPTVSGAGRTDAGVHALGQVASVNIDLDLAPSAIQRALNVRLPADVRVVGVVDTKPGFHAQFHATGKAYRYRIVTTPIVSPFERWFVWHAPEARDLVAMKAAAAYLVGTHDFASFQASGSAVRDTVRTIRRLELVADVAGISVEVDGDGFLRHMVRAITGTLVEVGSGVRRPDSMPDVLAARDRSAAGPTAPASGLTLLSVRYPAVC